MLQLLLLLIPSKRRCRGRRALNARYHAPKPHRAADKNRDNAIVEPRILYDGLLDGLASGESCFKYNVRDAMPSICYDDDSVNAAKEKTTTTRTTTVTAALEGERIVVTVSTPHRFPYGPTRAFFSPSCSLFFLFFRHACTVIVDRSLLLQPELFCEVVLCVRIAEVSSTPVTADSVDSK